MDYQQLLRVAIDEAKLGLAEGGIPIGACLADSQGRILGRGHNRRVQQQDRRSTARLTPSAKRAGNAAIATKSW